MSADGDGWAIHEQRYSSAGTAVGGEIQVNTHTTGHQYNPVVTGLADGGWVVTWHSEGQDGSDLGVYQQRYNANGTTRGGEIQVNTYFFGAQGYPSTTALADGGWVVTWVNAAQDGGGVGIYQQVYSSFGTAVGGEVQVSATGMFDAFNHSYVSALEDGGWIVAWTDMSASNQREIVFQRYDSVGEEVGERTVAVLGANGVAGLNGVSEASVTGLKDGGWVVTWYADAGDTATGAVYQQLYNADGTASGDAFKMNADSAHGYGSVTALDDGGWVVTWTEMGVDQSGSAVMQRVFHRDLNVAPTGTDNTVLGALEDHGYVFSVDDFGFFDTNGDRFTAVVITTLPSQGVLTFNGDAVSKGDVIPVSKIELLVWTPPANGHGAGMGSFTFQVMDDAGNANGGVNVDPTPRTAAFSVASVNDAPSGADNTNIVVEQNGSHQFAASDFGFTDVVDGNNFLAVVIATLPSSGSLKLNGTAVTVNQVIAVSDLSHLVWTPATGATGNDIGGFTFKVRDDGGVALGGVNTDPTAHVIKFDVEKANADPTLDHPLGDVVASQGSDFQLPVPSNTFSDADGDALSISAISADYATVSLDNGVYTITPASNFNGTLTLSYTVSDGNNGTVDATRSVAIAAVNDAPTDLALSASTLVENQRGATIGTFSATDADGDALTYTLAGGGGVFTIDAVTHELRLLPDQYLNYESTPRSFVTLDVSDGTTTVRKSFQITVVDTQEAPALISAVTFPGITEDDTANTGQMVGDLFGPHIIDEDANALKGIVVSGLSSTYGTWQYSLDGGATWQSVGSVSNASALLLGADDRIRFLPDGIHGEKPSITYHAWDQTSGTAGDYADISVTGGATAFSASFGNAFITVTGVNDAPVLTGTLSATVAEGASHTIAVSELGFSDPDDVAGGVTFTVSDLSHGTLMVNGVAATTFTGAQLAAGKVVFVHDGSETTSAGFDVSVEDGNEDVSIPTSQAFSFTVTPVDHAPTLTATPFPNLVFTEDRSGVQLFENVAADTGDSGQTFTSLTLTVAGAENRDYLFLGASYVLDLVDGTSSFSFAGQSLQAHVSVQNGTATVTIDGMNMNNTLMELFIYDMAYGNTTQTSLTGRGRSP